MKSIPIYWKGHVSIASKQPHNPKVEDLTNYIADSILQEDALSADIENNTIYFKVGWCRPFWSWKLLVSISSGIISITEEEDIIHINYRLRFDHLLIFATVFIAIMGVTSPEKIKFYFLGWLWLVGGNMLITAFTFRRFIKKCVSEAGDQIYYWIKEKQ